jgi:hypothetical protein
VRSKHEPHLAVVVREGELSLFDPESAQKRALAHFSPTWCEYDPGNELVWAIVESEQSLRLVVVDLQGLVREVVRFPGVLSWSASARIRNGDTVLLGQLSSLSSAPDLDVDLTSHTTLGVNQCHGDASWYCYERTERPPAEWVLKPEFRASMSALGAGVFTDTTLASSASMRARPAQGVSPAPMLARLPLDCAPDDCGQAIALPPSRHWLVLSAMSFGDYTHWHYQLFDPKERRYFLPRAASVRAAEPLQGDVWEPSTLFISPDGRFVMETGAIYSLEFSAVWDVGVVCGWVGEGSVLRLRRGD